MNKIITLLLIATSSISFAQQDPQFSQYQFNQMVINPAYAGGRDALSIVVDIRNQWGGFSGAPRTQSFSLHSPLKKKRIGLGLSGYADQIGPRSVVGVYGSFAYILPVTNKLKLSFGLRGGLLNYKFNWDAIKFKEDQDKATTSNEPQNYAVPDIDAGLYLKSNSFYCGISSTHLNTSNIYKIANSASNPFGGQTTSLKYEMQRHLFFVISKGFKAGESVVINPTIMVKSVKSITSADLNLNFLIKKRLWLGSFIRSGQTVGLLAQVYVTDKLRIGYTFDRSLNSTQNNLGSGHEIMIGFDFNTFKAPMLSPRYL